MRVLCITPYFYPKHGGLEKYAYEICKRIAEKNEIKVLCSGKGFGSYDLDNNLKIYQIPVSFRISNTPIPLRLPRIFGKIVEWCDVVYAHTPVPYFADISLLFKKNPVLLVYHSGGIYGSGMVGLLASVYKRFEKKVLSNADILVGVSNFVRERIGADEVIEPGVDLNFFRPRNFINKEDYILFVGQLTKGHDWKGLDLLIEAVSESGDKLVVAGGGELLGKYEKIGRELGANVVFKGFVEDSTLVDLYSKAKVFVLPSKSDQESFGMTLLEANACGTAVVGTNVGGIPCYVRNGKNGVLCKPKVDELVEAIFAAKENHRRLGKIGRRVSKKYSWDVSARKTVKELKKLV